MLAFALTINNLAGGFGSGMVGINGMVFILSLLMN